MKTIGLIGGMSWESSVEYYQVINETVRARLGGLHSAQSLMYSVDFAPIEELQRAGRWEAQGEILASAAQMLEQAGAGCVLLCTNTMHKVADVVQARIHIPLLHIADATAERIRAQGIRRIALLGTRFTMEEDFYKGRLRDKFGLDVLIPDQAERDLIHAVIYDELCLGITRDASREQYRRIITRMAENGAQGIILGCTEIGLLVRAEDSPVPIFDTARIHAEAAVDWALQEPDK